MDLAAPSVTRKRIILLEDAAVIARLVGNVQRANEIEHDLAYLRAKLSCGCYAPFERCGVCDP